MNAQSESYYVVSPGGEELVSIGLLSNGWQKWDTLRGGWAGKKTGAGQWGVKGVEILNYLILILRLN